MSLPLSSRPRAASGYGLLHWVLALGVLGVLCALALPPLNALLDRMRTDTLRMQLHATLATARSTAISRGRPIEACPSSDGIKCSDDWARGWLMYEPLVTTRPGYTPKKPFIVERRPRSKVTAFVSDGRPRIRFRPDGRNAGLNQKIRICISDRLYTEVVASIPGRIRSRRAREREPCREP